MVWNKKNHVFGWLTVITASGLNPLAMGLSPCPHDTVLPKVCRTKTLAQLTNRQYQKSPAEPDLSTEKSTTNSRPRSFHPPGGRRLPTRRGHFRIPSKRADGYLTRYGKERKRSGFVGPLIDYASDIHELWQVCPFSERQPPYSNYHESGLLVSVVRILSV